MALPVRPTLDDILKICRYISTKPTGTTASDAKRVLGSNLMDSRKVSALKQWGLIEDIDGRLKVTDNGRLLVKDTSNGLPRVLKNVIRTIEPYNAVIERATHSDEDSVTTNDVAAY